MYQQLWLHDVVQARGFKGQNKGDIN